MSVIYVREPGSHVRRAGERIVITKGREDIAEAAIPEIESLALIGSVQITTQALQALLESGVDVSFMTSSGKLIGQAGAAASRNVFLRLSQYELYSDLERRLSFARIIVESKAKNQIAMIRDHKWKGGNPCLKHIKDIEELKDSLSDAVSSNEIMGIEGKCAVIYFDAFAKMFHNSDFEFSGRNRRPPKDPINVLLSLGYTFLEREVTSALYAQSFEMYLGFLHGIRYGRQSLPLDIMEEFRQPIVDRFVLNNCNRRIFNRFDFEEEEGLPKFTTDGFRKYCQEFERLMNGADGCCYREIIRRQARLLKNAVMQKVDYHPFCEEYMEDSSCIS